MADEAPRFLERLRTAGIAPGDSDAQRLNKSLLMFATGLVSVTSILWLLIYWVLGLQLSATVPFAFQLLLAANLAWYLKSGNFELFRVVQLSLFLYFPFGVQLAIGNFVSASGIVLWGLLAPVGAILVMGARESVPWFVAYVFLVALSGVLDYFSAPAPGLAASQAVPTHTSVVFFPLNFIAVSTIVYLLLRFSMQEKQKAEARMQEAHDLLQHEQARSERLLLNVLPAPVAERLKRDDSVIADGYADVTVMFADIVNFTQVAEGLAPNQVFALLNGVFSRFDEMCERLGVEKIKTIGDAYMVAGGLHHARPDYSDAVAQMALEMREVAGMRLAPHLPRLEIRIGIATGPVVAGVVGRKKFIYDLWGDTVNLASRISSECPPGLVQVDSVTWKRLRTRFDFHEPQILQLKGKGAMPVYRLVGRRPDADDERDAPPPAAVSL